MAEDEDIRRARQARELAKKLAEQRDATPAADPLAELRASIQAGKDLSKAKSIEIPTIALEMAINDGDIAGVQTAATELGKAQGLTGSELRTFAYNTAQTAAKGEKPTPPPADEQYTYDYVWRQDVGGPGGSWTLVKSPNQGPADWKFDSNGMLFYKGKAFTGTYQGVQYTDGKGPGYKESGSGNKGPTGPTGPTGPQTTYTAPDGKIFTDLNAYNAYIAQTKQTAEKAARQSAYDLLFQQFDAYGLGGLVAPLRGLIESGINPAEFTIRLRETDAYKKRFAANASRIQKGLRALSEAEYIGLEDQYQDVMRRYGLPDTYYTRGEMGRQEGFEKFIGGDVSPVELEDRIQTAQRRVLNAPPQVTDALKQFYGAELGSGDILAYVLDPDKAIENIKRKVTAAEIGAGAMQAGLATGVSRAEELQRFGVTGEQARQGYQTIGGFLPRASQLGDIYSKQGLGAYTQTTAEQEVFGTTGAVDAERKRRQLAQLEQAQFGGSAGTTGGALGRERAGQF
jgi:hypothetical protein